jgi:hypothetical protein
MLGRKYAFHPLVKPAFPFLTPSVFARRYLGRRQAKAFAKVCRVAVKIASGMKAVE